MDLQEILTVDDVAALLKMSKQQIYEQTRMRARVRQAIPLPFLRINGNQRFRRSDIATWLDQLAEYEKGRRIQ
jgi:predicted DNA-binding transcriptional regulator AlpA